MNRILIFIFTSLILFSCKTAETIKRQDFTQLGIAQNGTCSSGDSIQTNETSVVNFTASNDSIAVTNFNYPKARQYNFIKKRLTNQMIPHFNESKPEAVDEPVKNISSTKGLRIFFPILLLSAGIIAIFSYKVLLAGWIVIALAVILFLLLNTNIFDKFKNNRESRSKLWQILFALLAILMGVIFIALATTEFYMYLSIVFTVIALMFLIYAIINILIRSQPKPKISKEEKRKAPYNKFALWAGIFFLLFLISLSIVYFMFMPYLYLVIYGSLLIALTLSIIALINMSRKSNYERGKPLSIIVLFFTLLPVVLMLSLIGQFWVEDIL